MWLVFIINYYDYYSNYIFLQNYRPKTYCYGLNCVFPSPIGCGPNPPSASDWALLPTVPSAGQLGGGAPGGQVHLVGRCTWWAGTAGRRGTWRAGSPAAGSPGLGLARVSLHLVPQALHVA